MNDDLNPDARRLVDLARLSRTPGAADKRRIAERLAVPLAAGAAVGTGAKAAFGAKVLLASAAFKVAAVLALGVAAVTAVVVAQQPEMARTTVPRVLLPKPAPLVSAARQALPPVAAPEPVTAPKPAVAARSASPTHELEEEAALLHQAQAAWRAGQSAQALKLSNQHAQRFPHSQLANERDVLRVLSLCKLGQATAAKQVADHLLRTAKGSPWYQSVAQSCATD